MTHNFDGRKLIVIGGSSGMGRQTAVDVVRCGAAGTTIAGTSIFAPIGRRFPSSPG